MRVAIDAGHGSNTAGKRTPKLPDGTVIREHTANVAVANLLETELRRCGIQTVRTGWNDIDATDDADTALAERQRFIKGMDCDISVSIHFNAFGNGVTFNSAEGVGIYIHSVNVGDSLKLAQYVQGRLIYGTKQVDRGIHKEAFAMVNCANLGVKAAILCELAFMTNLREAELMRNEAFLYECAVEIAKGVCEYLGVKYVVETKLPKSISVKSSKEDIIWMQTQLTKCLKGYTIKITGVYDSTTRIAVLMYWEQLGWGKAMDSDGKTIGKATIEALNANRKE